MQPDNKLDIIDLSKESTSEKDIAPIAAPWHPEKARMKLAYCVLVAIFSIFILSIIFSFLAYFKFADSELSKNLFEFSKTSLLPIVTLILGFYFSKNH